MDASLPRFVLDSCYLTILASRGEKLEKIKIHADIENEIPLPLPASNHRSADRVTSVRLADLSQLLRFHTADCDFSNHWNVHYSRGNSNRSLTYDQSAVHA